MPAKKRTYILGAGFSRLADFPLANDFLSFVSDRLSRSCKHEAKQYNEILSNVLTVFNEQGLYYATDNVELFLTIMDLSLRYKTAVYNELKPIYKKYISADDKYYFPDIILSRLLSGIREAFKIHHLRITNYKRDVILSDTGKNRTYNIFFNRLKQGDTIITLNYDVLCEQGLWLQNKWTFLDGYGFEKNLSGLLSNGHRGYPPDKPKKSLIKVYKIHGSITWAADEQVKNTIILLVDLPFYFLNFNGKSAESDNYRADTVSPFIFPSYYRSLINRPYFFKIWQQARDAIVNSDELYFIGYSLSDIDAALQFMIYDAIKTNNKLNKSNIFMIDNQEITKANMFSDENIFIRFDRFLGFRCKIIKKSFEDWVKESSS